MSTLVKNPSQTTRILRELKNAGIYGITSSYMVDNMRIFKYSSRIAELRKDGWNILAERESKSLWRYRLVPEVMERAD